jgi:hypothetical protein
MDVELTDGIVRIERFETSDLAVVSLLAGIDDGAERGRLVADALSIGARGLVAMGLGIRVEDLDARLRSAVDAATAEALRQLQAGVSEAVRHLTAGIDPGRSDSHSTRFLQELESTLGPGGRLLAGLKSALDPSGDSPLGLVVAEIRRDLAGLRDELMRGQGRAEEAVLGTRKGVRFEERLDSALRNVARNLGAIVEYTARTGGSLGSGAMVGDYVLTLGNGFRVVVEAKDQQNIALVGKNGILAELDRAMRNRDAQAGICISARASYPAEVGALGVYGNKVLVVDEGDSTMITTGLRWISAVLESQGSGLEIDLRRIEEGLLHLRRTCQSFNTQRASLTEVAKLVDRTRENLGELSHEVLTIVDALIREARGPAPVVELPRAAG